MRFWAGSSRGFRALKTWFTLKVYGLHALGETITRTCELARYLEQRVAATEELELLAPMQLNIVCFRYRCPDPDRANARIVVELQESGVAAPSTTRINGDLAIRAAITNHRTSRADIDALIDADPRIGTRNRAGTAPNWRRLILTSWAPALQRKEALREVEARFASDPESVDLRFERACLLAELGQNEHAKQAYLDVLARCPSHVGALNNLGTLLYMTGYRTAARSAYTEAIARHPDQPMAHVNLGNLFLEAGDLAQAREHYEAALVDRLQVCRGASGSWEICWLSWGTRKRPRSISVWASGSPRHRAALSRRSRAHRSPAPGLRPPGRCADPPFAGRQDLPDLCGFAERL